MTGAFLYIDKGILIADGMLAIEYDFHLSFEHIECLLHIGMDMCDGNLSFLESGDCYLGEGAASLATGEEDALLSHSMGGEDWGYVVEISDHD